VEVNRKTLRTRWMSRWNARGPENLRYGSLLVSFNLRSLVRVLRMREVLRSSEEAHEAVRRSRVPQIRHSGAEAP